MTNQKIQLVVKPEQPGLAEIREDWLQLARDNGTHFTHFPFWYESKLEHFPESENTCLFVCVYRQQQLVSVLPLEKKRVAPGLYYLQLFYPNEMGVCDIACAQGLNEEWPFLVKQIKQKLPGLLFIRLQHFWDDGHTETSGILSLSGFRKVSHQPSYLYFPHSYDNFISGYSSKFRRNVRRLTKKAGEVGLLSLCCISKQDELGNAFSIFMDLEASGWKGEEGSSIRQQANLKAYYSDFIQTYGALGQCRINLLYSGEKAIAGQFCLQVGKTLFLLKIAYDNEMSSLSPGQLMIDRVIQHGCETDAFNKLHFVTDYDWMARWKPNKQDAFLAYIPTSFLGSMALKVLSLRNRAQAFLKKQSEA